MKKLLFIVLVFSSAYIMGQKNKLDTIKTIKVGFLTEALDLTEKEAQGFWPIYNTFEEQMNVLRFKEMRDIRKHIRQNSDSMTNDEAYALMERIRKIEEQMHELKTDFSKKLSSIIPAKKIIKLKLAEEDFKRKMLDEFRKRKISMED